MKTYIKLKSEIFSSPNPAEIEHKDPAPRSLCTYTLSSASPPLIKIHNGGDGGGTLHRAQPHSSLENPFAMQCDSLTNIVHLHVHCWIPVTIFAQLTLVLPILKSLHFHHSCFDDEAVRRAGSCKARCESKASNASLINLELKKRSKVDELVIDIEPAKYAELVASSASGGLITHRLTSLISFIDNQFPGIKSINLILPKALDLAVSVLAFPQTLSYRKACDIEYSGGLVKVETTAVATPMVKGDGILHVFHGDWDFTKDVGLLQVPLIKPTRPVVEAPSPVSHLQQIYLWQLKANKMGLDLTLLRELLGVSIFDPRVMALIDLSMSSMNFNFPNVKVVTHEASVQTDDILVGKNPDLVQTSRIPDKILIPGPSSSSSMQHEPIADSKEVNQNGFYLHVGNNGDYSASKRRKVSVSFVSDGDDDHLKRHVTPTAGRAEANDIDIDGDDEDEQNDDDDMVEIILDDISMAENSSNFGLCNMDHNYSLAADAPDDSRELEIAAARPQENAHCKTNAFDEEVQMYEEIITQPKDPENTPDSTALVLWQAGNDKNWDFNHGSEDPANTVQTSTRSSQLDFEYVWRDCLFDNLSRKRSYADAEVAAGPSTRSYLEPQSSHHLQDQLGINGADSDSSFWESIPEGCESAFQLSESNDQRGGDVPDSVDKNEGSHHAAPCGSGSGAGSTISLGSVPDHEREDAINAIMDDQTVYVNLESLDGSDSVSGGESDYSMYVESVSGDNKPSESCSVEHNCYMTLQPVDKSVAHSTFRAWPDEPCCSSSIPKNPHQAGSSSKIEQNSPRTPESDDKSGNSHPPASRDTSTPEDAPAGNSYKIGQTDIILLAPGADLGDHLPEKSNSHSAIPEDHVPAVNVLEHDENVDMELESAASIWLSGDESSDSIISIHDDDDDDPEHDTEDSEMDLNGNISLESRDGSSIYLSGDESDPPADRQPVVGTVEVSNSNNCLAVASSSTSTCAHSSRMSPRDDDAEVNNCFGSGPPIPIVTDELEPVPPEFRMLDDESILAYLRRMLGLPPRTTTISDESESRDDHQFVGTEGSSSPSADLGNLDIPPRLLAEPLLYQDSDDPPQLVAASEEPVHVGLDSDDMPHLIAESVDNYATPPILSFEDMSQTTNFQEPSNP